MLRPKYASECLNYENLWKEVSETFTNEEDEEVMQISKLEAEPATKDASIPDYHPCEVAKNAGGIFGPFGGGRVGPAGCRQCLPDACAVCEAQVMAPPHQRI